MLVPQTGISTLGRIFSANYAMKEWNQRFYSSNQNPSIPRDSHLGSSGISPGCVKMQRTYGCIMSHEKCRDVSELHEMCLPFGRIDPCWICKAFRLHWSLLVVRIYENYERAFSKRVWEFTMDELSNTGNLSSKRAHSPIISVSHLNLNYQAAFQASQNKSCTWKAIFQAFYNRLEMVKHHFHTCNEFWNHPPVMATQPSSSPQTGSLEFQGFSVRFSF